MNIQLQFEVANLNDELTYLVKYSSSSLLDGLATVNIFQLISTVARSKIRTHCIAKGIGSE
jgi:hypothetical protein